MSLAEGIIDDMCLVAIVFVIMVKHFTHTLTWNIWKLWPSCLIVTKVARATFCGVLSGFLIDFVHVMTIVFIHTAYESRHL